MAKSLSTRKRQKTEPKAKQHIRNKYFDYCNEKRQLHGKPRLEEMPNSTEIIEHAEGFGYLYDELLKGKKKAHTIINDNYKVNKETNDKQLQLRRKREVKSQHKELEQEHCTLTDALTDVPSNFTAVAQFKPNDPQGYAMLFANFINGPR